MPVADSAPGSDLSTWRPLYDLQKSLVWFYPGAAQGITTVLLGHPLDTAKTRLQADHHQTLKTRSSIRVMCGMFKGEGLKSLYKGVTPPLLVMGSKRSLQFALWERIKRPVAAPGQQEGPIPQDSKHRTTVKSIVLGAKETVATNNFLSGAISGALGTTLGCPMHVIKIQTQNGTGAASRNAFHCAVHVWREEGLRGFYRGFPAHVMKDVLFAGTYLGLYETLRLKLSAPQSAGGATSAAKDDHPSPAAATTTLLIPRLALPAFSSDQGADAGHKEDDRCASITSPSPRSGNLVVFTAGTIASCITWVCLYPFDTLKTAIQARNPLTLRTFVSGPGGFIENPMKAYRGLAAALVRAGPVSGVAMVAYETVKSNVNAPK